MKNPKAPQQDPVSGTIAHEGVNKAMNDPMGTASSAAADLDTDKLTDSETSVADAFTDSDRIDPDSLTNEMAEDGQDNVQEGLTPMHRQNIDDSRIDEVLVDDSLDNKNYPNIRDIADDDAVEHSFDDE